MINGSNRIIRGNYIGDQTVKEILTRDGSRIQDWWKSETPTFQSRVPGSEPAEYAEFNNHFYEHVPTGTVSYEYPANPKLVFRELIYPPMP